MSGEVVKDRIFTYSQAETMNSKLDAINTTLGNKLADREFANVLVGSTTVQSTLKGDTLTLVAGDNISLTPDNANKKITIGATGVVKTSGDQTVAGTKTFSSVPVISGSLAADDNSTKVATTEWFHNFGSGAGFHNSIYRGKSLGSSFTATQSTNIQNGTFKDLFVGDYWTIPVSFSYYKATTDSTAQSGKTYYSDAAGTAVSPQPSTGASISSLGYFEKVTVSNQSVIWRVAGFDYWYNKGDTNFTTHHAVIVPDSALYNAQMHITNTGGYVAGAANTTEGGYQATDLFKGLGAAQSAAEAAFGASHVPSHKVLLPTTCTGGKYTGWAWASRKVDIMTETMVYGHRAWGDSGNNGYSVASQYGQLPLFRLRPDIINLRYSYWLQDVSSASYFAFVYYTGNANIGNASYSHGVRPAFALI